jgi:hypothetical protein
MPYRFLFFVISVLVIASPNLAMANDSIARVGVGGLVLKKSESIRMLQEKPTISTTKITVRYRFINDSSQDLKETVAFPMPVYKWDPDGQEFANQAPVK